MLIKPYIAACGAILLWSLVAAFSYKLAHLPPLFLTGAALLIGGLFSIFKIDELTFNRRYLIIGTFAIFFYHLLLFAAFQTAPLISANLINYLWPIFIVLFAKLYNKKLSLKLNHILGIFLGLIGACLALVSDFTLLDLKLHLGYIFAFLAAITWANYSLFLNQYPDINSWTISLCCLLAGLCSLIISPLFETSPTLSSIDFMYLVLLGLGPLGLSFKFWDHAMKKLSPHIVGTLSYFTPIFSTLWLNITMSKSMDIPLLLSLVFITFGAYLATKKQNTRV